MNSEIEIEKGDTLKRKRHQHRGKFTGWALAEISFVMVKKEKP